MKVFISAIIEYRYFNKKISVRFEDGLDFSNSYTDCNSENNVIQTYNHCHDFRCFE